MVGKPKSAVLRRLNEARDLDPAAAKHLKTAWALLDKGKVAEAEQILACAIALAPTHACTLRIQGEILYLQNRHAEAAAVLSAQVEADATDGAARLTLASALENCGQYESALAALRRACEVEPTGESWFALGLLCDRHGDHEQALFGANQCLAVSPGHAGAGFLRARSLQALGDISETMAQYRDLIRRRVQVARAWFGLVDLKTASLSESEVEELSRQYSLARPGTEEAVLIGFALGRVLEQANDYRGAFEVLGAANSAVRARTTWNSAAHSRQVMAIRDAFPHRIDGAANPEFGNEVLFLVGLPRSGSTLVEQILAAHSHIEGASELPDLTDVLDEESGRRRVEYPAWVESASPDDWLRMGREYLRRTSRWRRNRPMSTDKSLDNWKHVGAIRAMLPGARIIDCRRDPLETTWSCYKQLFAPGCAGFSYEFGDLVRYWSDYVFLTSHWASANSARYRSQSLEKLLNNTRSETESLIEFAGLPFEESCLHSHLAVRSVRTASAAQVRQPLGKSVQSAPCYGELLDPLRAGLAGPPECGV